MPGSTAWAVPDTAIATGCARQLRRRPDVATAIISLASSVVGGLLVLGGQWLIKRSDDRRYWLGQLRDAAADVATSFSRERTILTSDRGQGKAPFNADEVPQVADRQQALNRLSCSLMATLSCRHQTGPMQHGHKAGVPGQRGGVAYCAGALSGSYPGVQRRRAARDTGLSKRTPEPNPCHVPAPGLA